MLFIVMYNRILKLTYRSLHDTDLTNNYYWISGIVGIRGVNVLSAGGQVLLVELASRNGLSYEI